ncbi:uncharacterized protein VTP21DRAFT_9411 [Calcarisporiella thermophila]|uniref:uncharacterized protein n=1 Tax=Calcarisporiella thermophila TaxID=911321 RepID=UPI003743F309
MLVNRPLDVAPSTSPLTNHYSIDTKSIPHPMLEFIPNRLYFTWLESPPECEHDGDLQYFTVDHYCVYFPFHLDFGPMHVGHIFRFCGLLHEKIESSASVDNKLCLYTSADPHRKTNTAFLLCTYLMIVRGLMPEDACAPLSSIASSLIPYRDAGQGPDTYQINILDCLRGLYRAIGLRLLNLDQFNLEEYEFFEKVENGDLNWITPKFIAFASPEDNTYSPNSMRRPPRAFDVVINYFRKVNVKLVIRLNRKIYAESRFESVGIRHIDLAFPDGTCPPEGVLRRFLRICEEEKGVIAVHCMAGLGRTGTLIGCYLMKHYHFTAAEVIAFMRIMRPGMVVGPQQNYLEFVERSMWQATSTPLLSSPTGVSPAAERRHLQKQQPQLRTKGRRKSLTGRAGQTRGADEKEKVLVVSQMPIPKQPRKTLSKQDKTEIEAPAAKTRRSPVTRAAAKASAASAAAAAVAASAARSTNSTFTEKTTSRPSTMVTRRAAAAAAAAAATAASKSPLRSKSPLKQSSSAAANSPATNSSRSRRKPGASTVAEEKSPSKGRHRSAEMARTK